MFLSRHEGNLSRLPEEGQSDFPSNGRALGSRGNGQRGAAWRPAGAGAGAATGNRCIAGAYPERLRECRGELKSFTST